MPEYQIINDKIKPDMAGELHGAKIWTRDGKRFVTMSPNQAKMLLEQGQIKASSAPNKSKR